MRPSLRFGLRRIGPLLAGVALLSAAPAAPDSPPVYAAFAKQNDAAMAIMMADMAVRPTGNIDVDFVAMMIPHHQGAIDMARAVLRYGHNETLKTLARNIVATQTKEIAIMRAAVGGQVPIALRGEQHRMRTP